MIAERIRDSTSDPERPNSFVASACARATPLATPSPIPPPVRFGSERNPRARWREGGAGFACDGRSPKGGASKEERALPATGAARRAEHPRRSGLCLRRAQPEGRSIQDVRSHACSRLQVISSQGRPFEAPLPAKRALESAPHLGYPKRSEDRR